MLRLPYFRFSIRCLLSYFFLLLANPQSSFNNYFSSFSFKSFSPNDVAQTSLEGRTAAQIEENCKDSVYVFSCSRIDLTLLQTFEYFRAIVVFNYVTFDCGFSSKHNLNLLYIASVLVDLPHPCFAILTLMLLLRLVLYINDSASEVVNSRVLHDDSIFCWLQTLQPDVPRKNFRQLTIH